MIRQTSNPKLVALMAALSLLLIATATAQDAGSVIPFQGQLASQSGEPLSPPAPTTLVFRLYRQAVGGVAMWEESQPNLSVNVGRFSVLLGSRTELPAAPNFNATLYLGITVDDGNPATADVEMRPRQAIVPVINAAYARNADKLRNYDWSVLFGTNNPIDGKIQGTRIANRSITSAQIGPAQVGRSEIANGTIDAIHFNPTLALRALNPTGTIVPFAGPNAPDGWFPCDGRFLSRQDYADLYAAIGQAWGSTASENFRVPDLQGVFLRGLDTGAGYDEERPSRHASKEGGNAGANVGSIQGNTTRLPNRPFVTGGESNGHSHPFDDIYFSERFGPSGNLGWVGSGSSDNDNGPYTTGSRTAGNTQDHTHQVVAGGDFETRPTNVYVNYIIKY